jgi:hypothetical protein
LTGAADAEDFAGAGVAPCASTIDVAAITHMAIKDEQIIVLCMGSGSERDPV